MACVPIIPHRIRGLPLIHKISQCSVCKIDAHHRDAPVGSRSRRKSTKLGMCVPYVAGAAQLTWLGRAQSRRWGCFSKYSCARRVLARGCDADIETKIRATVPDKQLCPPRGTRPAPRQLPSRMLHSIIASYPQCPHGRSGRSLVALVI